MAEERRALKLACLCGGAQTEITLPESVFPMTAAFCHCNSCRHLSGCLCVTSIPLLTEDLYRPTDDLLENLTAFEFSENKIFHYFCRSCGTQILAHVLPRERNNYTGRWFAMCGAIENVQNVYRPRHEYIADTLDGGFSDFLITMAGKPIDRWAHHPQGSDRVPLHWVDADRCPPHPSSKDKLHAYCKCKGIEFWISRPLNVSKYPTRICACKSCRLAHGMEWFVGAMASVSISQISLHENGLSNLANSPSFGTLRTYSSSTGVRRSFYSICGATVFYHREGEYAVAVAVGLFDAAEGARAESWLEWNFKEVKSREGTMQRCPSLTLAFHESSRHTA